MQNTSSPTTITSLISTCYYYYPQTLTTTSSTDATTGIATASQEYKTVFCNDFETDVTYWLANKYIAFNEGRAFFNMRAVTAVKKVYGYCLYYSDGIIDRLQFAVRPVVSLKSDIKLTGSSEAGWTIQK